MRSIKTNEKTFMRKPVTESLSTTSDILPTLYTFIFYFFKKHLDPDLFWTASAVSYNLFDLAYAEIKFTCSFILQYSK